jgi:hypothetical protein
MTDYQNWITAHFPDAQTAYGQCVDATVTMAAAFPELRRVRGHYFCLTWGMRAHWWLVTEDGRIVDPTAAQFPSQGQGLYEPWIEGDTEPTGKCMNCGGYTYDGKPACSETCERELAAYYGGNFHV